MGLIKRAARLAASAVRVGLRQPVAASDEAHLEATMDWLARAQDACAGGGVAARYCIVRGWSEPYPETTGYIIPTLIRCAALTGEEKWLDRARRMAEWELAVQLPSGAIPGRTGRSGEAIVFDTGQVIFGWLCWHRVARDDRCIDAARRAAEWLVAVQESDGSWRRHEYLGVAHAYHSRVAWPLLALAQYAGERTWTVAATRNLEWILSNVGQNGWIDRMSFNTGLPPFSHTVGYTLEGLWCASSYVETALAQQLRHSVMTAWRGLANLVSDRGFMPGRVGVGWRADSRSVCLTGNAQLAGLALRLADATGDPDYCRQARRLLDRVKGAQRLHAREPGIRGGVAGSAPVYGSYLAFQYPNWAAKFTADALMDFVSRGRQAVDPALWDCAEG